MHVVSAPMDDGYGKMRVCEFLPIAFVSHTGQEIDVVKYDTQLWDYHDRTLTVLLETLADADLVPGEEFTINLPDVVSNFKTVTEFKDIELPQTLVYVNTDDDVEDEWDEWEDEDDEW